jgi:hypothetical protein
MILQFLNRNYELHRQPLQNNVCMIFVVISFFKRMFVTFFFRISFEINIGQQCCIVVITITIAASTTNQTIAIDVNQKKIHHCDNIVAKFCLKVEKRTHYHHLDLRRHWQQQRRRRQRTMRLLRLMSMFL